MSPRFGRDTSNYDLHEKAGGLPLPTITAPNVHPSSKRGREVCKQAGKSNFPSKKCGSKRTYQRTKQEIDPKLFGIFLIKRVHNPFIDGFQLLLILDGAQDRQHSVTTLSPLLI